MVLRWPEVPWASSPCQMRTMISGDKAVSHDTRRPLKTQESKPHCRAVTPSPGYTLEAPGQHLNLSMFRQKPLIMKSECLVVGPRSQ